jgi:hypothetical protein
VAPLKFDQLNRWQLSRAINEAWRRLKLFPTAEAAMAAVAEGNTGVDTWDAGRREGDFAADHWSMERW